METIFDVGRKRALFIRLMVPLFSILMGIPMIGVGWLFMLPGSYQGEDPINGPYWLGFLFGLAFLLGGLAIAIGGWVYGAAYVSRIEVDRDEDRVRVSVLGWVRGWSFTVSPDDVVSGRWHDGGTAVNAPWTTLRIRGRRLPLIVDDHSEVYEPAVDTLVYHGTLDPPPLPKRVAVEMAKRKIRKKKTRG